MPTAILCRQGALQACLGSLHSYLSLSLSKTFCWSPGFALSGAAQAVTPLVHKLSVPEGEGGLALLTAAPLNLKTLVYLFIFLNL